MICSFDGIFMISSTLRNTSFYRRELSEILTILVDWRPGTHSPGARASKIMKNHWFSKVSRGPEGVARGQGIEKHGKPLVFDGFRCEMMKNHWFLKVFRGPDGGRQGPGHRKV